jgi:hypothetical protein
MINAKKLINAINEEYYNHLDKCFPNWLEFPGKGSYYRSMNYHFLKVNGNQDLWALYKREAIAKWRFSKLTR